MLTVTEAQERVSHLVESAKKAGADTSDALYSGGVSTEVQIRLGELEDVERSEGEEIGLRFFIGKRSASVSSSDLSDDALAVLVERAAAMAREAPEDQYAGLAPQEMLFRGELPQLDIDDGGEGDPQALRDRALAAEDAARAVKGVTNSEGGGASASRSIMALATSHGFCSGYQATSYGCSASVIAGEGSGMQRDYAYRTARHLADLDSPESIGTRAGERTVGRLNPAKLPSGTIPVVFDPRVSGGLLGHLVGAITGSSITRGTSFLRDSLEEQIFASGITILDDPLRTRGLRSRPFDGEGLRVSDRKIIDDGMLTGWLLDSASARQLGLQPTGNAKRGIGGPPGAGTTNLHLEAGSLSRDELIADITRGVLVTELIGQGVNPVTGDYSRGASGFLIENGAIGAPVAEITIAGNLKDMFRELVPANDLEFIHGINAPTVRIEGLTVAGA
ncbi:TldD/PmbA family protein [Parasphingopyxis marina]|uniref:TldD/PmbA family protein n=1 Tax=Parasphingopyxis marina TaxID=2761622 RepID=A0A842I2N3_9SPHN|nr:metallopeptidase TldD-related protein [Parasphingopyxis marina]MBC2778540.1 TldD/PmbA family protein [Parasphingopyxis marina]